MRGTLFLVVGPSGAGKDTLIDAARKALEPGGRYVFPKRFITRPSEDASERHLPVDNATFERMAKAGQFALHWPAHGWRYGIPAAIEEDLAAGRHVVVNVSRAVVAEAVKRFAPVQVVQVTAREDVRARRLAARGREALPEIEARLKREAIALPPDTKTVHNDAAPETAIAAFIAVLAG
jgi:phosphonate metabolism protein PhnN/1,5-bisphosphokinase (PRPP-forming)